MTLAFADCRVPPRPADPPVRAPFPPVQDYLARDYDSYLRGLLDLLPARAPGWREYVEADPGVALLEALALAADQLSYFQDRATQEGFLRTARRIDSVRRHLRLVDYALDPGCAANVILQIGVTARIALDAGFQVRTEPGACPGAVIYESVERRVLHPELNRIVLAQDAPLAPDRQRAELLGRFDAARLPTGARLLFERPGGTPTAAPTCEWAELAEPPQVNDIAGTTLVVLRAALGSDFPAALACAAGNGVLATHGETRRERIAATGAPGQQLELAEAPLTFLDQGGGARATTLAVLVDGEAWTEVGDFIDSDPGDRHYRVTRDQFGGATVHFGDGRRGLVPAAPRASFGTDPANIAVRYRIGIGGAGLVAAEALRHFVPTPGVDRVRNPRSSGGAVEPESIETAKVLGPRTVRRQNRAVTTDDFERLVLAGVTVVDREIRPVRARAWRVRGGSWPVVRVAVELPGHAGLASVPGLEAALEERLGAAKVVGWEVDVRDPRYAPVCLQLTVHLRPDAFSRQLGADLARVLGPDGYFAPARWGFGDPLHLSDLYAAVMAHEGVAAVSATRFKRMGRRHPDQRPTGTIAVDPLTIIRCDQDLSHPEHGMLVLHTCGGRDG